MKLQDLYYIVRKYIKRGQLLIVNNGYIHKEPEPGDYHFGAVAKEVLRQDRQWTDCLPEDERQSGRLVESMGCTGYGTNNGIEIYVKAKYKLQINLSDRALNKASGVTKAGNNVNTVLETVRKIFGAVAENLWTWDRDTFTWETYYATLPKKIYDVGKNWLNFDEFFYENVITTPKMMWDGLQYSPLLVAGYAWYLENELYRSYGQANHFFVIVGGVYGQYWLAYDSYSPFLKKLAWDFRFASCKCITLNIKEPIKDYSLGVTDAQAEINNMIKTGYKYIQRPQAHGEIYRLTGDGLVFIENKDEIANDIASNIKDIPEAEKQKVIDSVIRAMVADKILIGINEELFNKMI